MTPLLLLCKYASFGRNREHDMTIYLFMKYLLNEGANPQATDLEDQNCLHYIVRATNGLEPHFRPPYQVLAFQLLLSAGCDPNALNKVVCTPFDVQHEPNGPWLWSILFEGTSYEARGVESVRIGFEVHMAVIERGSCRLPLTDLLIDEWVELKKRKDYTYELQVNGLLDDTDQDYDKNERLGRL
jgi:ankyrin repeat protein